MFHRFTVKTFIKSSIELQFGLVTYCISFGDINRILNGYDNCGNVCGRNNQFADVDINSGCHGIDMTKHKYLRVQSWSLDAVDSDIVQINRICVENCSDYSGLLVSLKINKFFWWFHFA